MNVENRKYLSLFISIFANVLIGWVIGYFTKPELSNWYNALTISPLTPQSYVFSIVWTILYGMIGACGWLIWNNLSLSNLKVIKNIYLAQLVLNWSWSHIFFHHKWIGISLATLILIDILVGALIFITYQKELIVPILLFPYFLWILFASYLNFFIWFYN